MVLGGALGSVLVAGDAAALCVAGVALGDIYLRLAWQAWHLVTSTFVLRGRRGTYGTGWRAWVGFCRRWRRGTLRGRRGTWRHLPWFGVVGVAQSHIHLRFAWQAWHHLWHTLFHTPLCHTPLCHTPSFTTPSSTHHFVTTPFFTHNFVTHHLWHTIFHTPLCHTPSLTHPLLHTIFVTHHLSHTILHTPLCHTPSFTTPSFTHHFVTHHLSHITLPHTIFHHTIFRTQLCHTPSFATPSFTHDFVTYHLSHTTLSHALFHTHNFHTHHLSHTALSHTHTIFLCHTPSFTFHFVTHNFLNFRSFTTSFAFPSFSVPATTFGAHYWKKLPCGVIRSFNLFRAFIFTIFRHPNVDTFWWCVSWWLRTIQGTLKNQACTSPVPKRYHPAIGRQPYPPPKFTQHGNPKKGRRSNWNPIFFAETSPWNITNLPMIYIRYCNR